MTVDHIPRPVFFEQGVKYLKPPVGQVILVVDPTDRRMGQENVKSMAAQEREKSLPCPGRHLLFIVLMGAAIIVHGSPQAEDTDAFKVIDLAVYVDASVRVFRCIDAIVVPMHI